ncbi:hypothetical protein H6P81_003317 [Aristolochia fimbriata]|uniref:Protein kinase domain-containing protein n=1 Tax=Aristolochia fimbriata TaxID=158543 RepID=A0AAV7FDY3_ARIFI|nr:hypothetical protein H6P81_003317 [Aristolochia fimbriata]
MTVTGIIKSQPGPKRWVKGNVVGCGSFGTVNLAMNKCNGELFVVKSAPPGNAAESLEMEATILEDLDSPHVVRYLGHDFSEEADGVKTFNLFMEYMAGGSLSDVSKKFGGVLDESVIRLYTREILQGLAYLHRNGIVHCDIKCKNVLLGSSVLGNQMPPSSASDVWSLGCTLIEMATGRPPWADQVSDPMAAIFKIACGDDTPAFPTNLSPQGLDFLRKCLKRDPKSRWTCEQLLNHPFVSQNSPGSTTCSGEQHEHHSYSPTSILFVDDWDSESSDGTDSPDGAAGLSARTPFSMFTRKLQRRQSDLVESDNWIDVRSA